MRFAKGLDSHVGIYPYMFQHFCRHFGRPVRWLNFEQDMGLPGFRRSKRSYGPAGLISKLRVALRGETPGPASQSGPQASITDLMAESTFCARPRTRR